MTDERATPVSTRIESLDFVRGCALFGILLMNVVGMGLSPAYDNPTIMGGATGINLWTWFVMNVGFEGTQRALFSMLFGSGVILLSSRLEASGRPDSADIYFRRQMWLVAFGLFNAWVLLWGGDILFYYGVTALFLFAFRKLAGRTLLGLGLGALLLAAAWSAIDSRGLLRLHAEAEAASQVAPATRTEAQNRSIERWAERSRFGPPPERVEQLRQAMTGTYWTALREMSRGITRHQSWFLYRYFLETFGTMLIGMALFRLGVLTLEARTRTYLAMMAAGYAIGLSLNLYEATWVMNHGFSSLAYSQAAITYDLSRLSMTMGHLGLLMLFLRSGILPWLRRSMAAVGRMALTNYLMHSVVALVVFVLLGFWGAFERHQLYFLVLAVWLFQLAASPLWLRHFHFGPVEWLWRYLSYLKKPPFRHSRDTAALPEVAVPAG